MVGRAQHRLAGPQLNKNRDSATLVRTRAGFTHFGQPVGRRSLGMAITQSGLVSPRF